LLFIGRHTCNCNIKASCMIRSLCTHVLTWLFKNQLYVIMKIAFYTSLIYINKSINVRDFRSLSVVLIFQKMHHGIVGHHRSTRTKIILTLYVWWYHSPFNECIQIELCINLNTSRQVFAASRQVFAAIVKFPLYHMLSVHYIFRTN
jgi:hypothetical protein